MSWVGPATYTSKAKDISKHADMIRDVERTMGRDAALRVASAALRGISAWIVTAIGPRELLAILDSIRNDIMRP